MTLAAGTPGIGVSMTSSGVSSRIFLDLPGVASVNYAMIMSR